MSQPVVSAIVMAAGKGTRLKSETPKVLHALFGRPLLAWVLEGLSQAKLSVQQTLVVVGHQKNQVNDILRQLAVDFTSVNLGASVTQEPQLGTGHAIQQVKAGCSKDALKTLDATSVLILSGDVPLLTAQSLERLVDAHVSGACDLSLLVAHLDNPSGYGRVLMQPGTQPGEKRVEKIVEEKDASPVEKLVMTVNTGIYCLNWKTISPLLDLLSANNAQGEFYLTDVIALAVERGLKVNAVHLDDALEMCGINHRLDLSLCHEILHQRTVARLMDNGVTVLQPASSMLSPQIQVGADTVIYPGCTMGGAITIGKGCEIGPQVTLTGPVHIGDNSRVLHSVIKNTVIGSRTSVGPFAHLRDGAVLSDEVRIGNFVEVKNTEIASGSNAAHLAYLGDATLGSGVNIGAGTIIANYDPIRKQKHHTVIENDVKIGCNSVLVSPVTVAEGACVAAGSVITHNVSPWSLAIARGRQQELADWVKKVKSTV